MLQTSAHEVDLFQSINQPGASGGGLAVSVQRTDITDIARCSSLPGISMEQLGALLHVVLRNKDTVEPDIEQF